MLVVIGVGISALSNGQSMLIWAVYWGLALLGAVPAISVASDSTAWWMHTISPISGRDDRLGRLVANMVLAVPLTLIIGGVLPLIFPTVPLGPARSAVAAFTGYCAATGAGLITSGIWLYPTKAPGASMMTSNSQGQSLVTVLTSLLNTLVISIGLAIPILLIFFVPSLYIAVPLAFLFGILLLFLGVVLGGKIIDTRRAKCLEKISSWPGHKLRL